MERKDKVIATFVIFLLIILYSITNCDAQNYYDLSSELGGRFIYGQNLVLKANQSTNLYYTYPTRLEGFYAIKIETNNAVYISIDTLKTYANELEYRFYTNKPFNVYISAKEKTKIAIVIHYFGKSSK